MHTLSGLQINNRIGDGYYVHSATAHTLAFTGVGSLGSLISNPPKIPFLFLLIPGPLSLGRMHTSLSEARFFYLPFLLVSFFISVDEYG